MTIRIVFKGGPGSGNWGHAGRPNKVGGSVPNSVALSIRTGKDRTERRLAARQRTAQAKVKSTKEKLEELKKKPLTGDTDIDTIYFRGQRYFEADEKDWDASNGTLKQCINQAYNYTDEQSGFTAKVTTVDANSRYITVVGTVKDIDGRTIGEFRREIRNTGYSFIVSNEYFALQKDAQGTGFGRRFYRNAEETYLQSGNISDVTIYANIDVGGYAWARMGYDFAGPTNHVPAFNERYGTNLPSNTPAYKLAVTTVNGNNAGKEYLLGQHWLAIKPIDVDNEGFIAGYEYMSR